MLCIVVFIYTYSDESVAADAKDKPRTVVMDKSKGEPVISVQGDEKKEDEKVEVKKEDQIKNDSEDVKPVDGGTVFGLNASKELILSAF